MSRRNYSIESSGNGALPGLEKGFERRGEGHEEEKVVGEKGAKQGLQVGGGDTVSRDAMQMALKVVRESGNSETKTRASNEETLWRWNWNSRIAC